MGTFLPVLPHSPVPADPRAPWCSQERTAERGRGRGEGTPEAKTSLNPAPLLFFSKTLDLSQSCRPAPPRPRPRLTAEHRLDRQERMSARSPQSSAMFLCRTGRLCSYLTPAPAEESPHRLMGSWSPEPPLRRGQHQQQYPRPQRVSLSCELLELSPELLSSRFVFSGFYTVCPEGVLVHGRKYYPNRKSPYFSRLGVVSQT